MWPAISKQNVLGFQYYLMSIPIESAQPLYLSCLKLLSILLYAKVSFFAETANKSLESFHDDEGNVVAHIGCIKGAQLIDAVGDALHVDDFVAHAERLKQRAVEGGEREQSFVCIVVVGHVQCVACAQQRIAGRRSSLFVALRGLALVAISVHCREGVVALVASRDIELSICVAHEHQVFGLLSVDRPLLATI